MHSRTIASSDQSKTGISEEDAVAATLEAFKRAQGPYSHGHDYTAGLVGAPEERLGALARAIDWVLRWQENRSLERPQAMSAVKQAHRAFQDFAWTRQRPMPSHLPATRLRASGMKWGSFRLSELQSPSPPQQEPSPDPDRAFAVQQLIDRAVASTEIIDVLRAAGVESPEHPEFFPMSS